MRNSVSASQPQSVGLLSTSKLESIAQAGVLFAYANEAKAGRARNAIKRLKETID
jgi:hypothetical protein